MGLYNRQTGRLGVVRQLQRAPLAPWYDSILSGTSDDIDVQNIPQTGTILKVYLFSRSSTSATGSSLYMWFNNDSTAANYRNQYTRGNNSTAAAAAADTVVIGDVPAATTPANYFGFAQVTIMNYADTAYTKVAQILVSTRRAASDTYVWQTLLHWENTAAINRITFGEDTLFIAGSRLQIWIYP